MIIKIIAFVVWTFISVFVDSKLKEREDEGNPIAIMWFFGSLAIFLT